MTEFLGAARRLTDDDIRAAAVAMAVEEACVRAVLTVETGGAGGFQADGRPRILHEGRVFTRLCGKPCPSGNAYQGGAAEYDRLARSIAVNRKAALQATSWGLFQVLGLQMEDKRFRDATGYADVEAFVTAMMESEVEHLRAFRGYCEMARLLPALRERRWADFARGYNGPGYAANAYDVKLANAYDLAVNGQGTVRRQSGALRIGMTGTEVRLLQAALAARGVQVTQDGVFGRVTEIKLMEWQARQGLTPDGIAGLQTRKALGMPT